MKSIIIYDRISTNGKKREAVIDDRESIEIRQHDNTYLRDKEIVSIVYDIESIHIW